MAADQWSRRLNSSTFIGCSFREKREQYRAKMKRLGSQQDDLYMRSNIALEWDDKNKSVVAKREQIGILQRDLVPFIDAVPYCHSSLADILAVPREIFELENLSNVLSYEVWQTNISETERNNLIRFLPREAEPEKVVQELLSGDNFHFGNPFLKWGASLCSGKLHPDDILQQEQCIKANKKTYFSELQNYHNDMIENLQMWKDRWDRCKDPEEEILPKIWRSTRQSSKRMQLSETMCDHHEENNVATPESCSWATSEKACSNDNNSNFHGDSQGREGFSESTVYYPSDGLKVVAKPKKGEKLQKRNICLGGGAKYMSCIKVSKKQHQLVKRTMKHSNNGIQRRSLDIVLGNIDSLHVQPFEVFEEEERQKLHVYWLQLANKEIPTGYASWVKKKMKAQQMVKSLGQELGEKMEFQDEDDEKDYSHNLPPELTDDVEATVSRNLYCQGGKREVYHSSLEDLKGNQVTKNEIAIASKDEEEKKTDLLLPRQTSNGTENMEEDDESVSLSAEKDHEDMTLDSHDNDMIAKADDLRPIVSKFPANINHIDIPVSQGDPPDSADDVWAAVVPGSFFHSASLGQQYVSSSELSHEHPQMMEEQPARLITLEADAQEKDSGRGDLLLRESDDLTFYSSFPNQEHSVQQEKNDGKQTLHRQPDDISFFSAYSTQDRNELLESFFKGQGGGLPYNQGGGLPYNHEQKRMGLDFHQPDNLTMENGQFSTQFGDQIDLSLPVEMRQKRMNDLYVDHNIQGSLYSDGDRYSIPKHLQISAQEWGVSTVGMLTPSQSHSNGGDLGSQNWFPVENRTQGGWSGLGGATASSRSIGGQSHADQSLFSVLSECNELHSGASAPCYSLGSAERFMQSGTYGGLGGGIRGTSNILEQTADQLNYFSRHETSTGRKTNNLGWISVSQLHSGLQESVGKPFVRSWNQ